MHFDELYKSSKAHSKPLVRTPTEPNLDAVGDNRPVNVLVDSTGANIPSMSKAPNGHGITRQYVLFLEFEGSWDECRKHQGQGECREEGSDCGRG